MIERDRLRRIGLLTAPLLVAAAMLLRSPVPPDEGDGTTELLRSLGSVVTAAIGSIILWRRPGQGVGRLMLASGLVAGGGSALPFLAALGRFAGVATTPSVVRSVADVVTATGLFIGSVLVVVRFPSGSRASRLGTLVEGLIWLSIVLNALDTLFPTTLDQLDRLSVLPFITFPLAALDVGLRYRTADRQTRTQFRWLIAASSMSGGFVVLILFVGDSWSWLWDAWIISTVLPTVAIGVGITRYRLYEIDRIISRSIGYLAISVVLSGAFAGVNLVLQTFISPIAGGESLAVAGTTLVVAALFSPVRSRVQTIVDRRFHRARHDAESVVAAFAGRLRVELDLGAVAVDLEATAAGALDPVASSVWIRPHSVAPWSGR